MIIVKYKEFTKTMELKSIILIQIIRLVCGGLLDQFSTTWNRMDRIQIDVNLPWLPFENETRCYEDLGCLNITRNWYHLIHRPINIFPLPRKVINTRFHLYTRSNPNEGHQLTVEEPDTIRTSQFDSKKRTKFIIHGFIDTPLSNWVKDMKDELIKSGDMNVVVVDWAGGSLPLYTQATANTRLVGMEIAHLIQFLQKNKGLDARDVHLIGHSLGAHTAGYAGSILGGGTKLGRITGLDPAEPFFQGMPSLVRLDPTDANFVDVIHTDGKGIIFLGYGMSQTCGHLDFYPNNGKEQPGCDITQSPLVPLTLIREGLEEASRVLVACNHIRAIKLFIDSINSQCPYIGHQCQNFDQFMAGKCFKCIGSSTCAIMGYHAGSGQLQDEMNTNELVPPGGKISETTTINNNNGRKFYLTTGKEFPFCRRLYRVTIVLAKPTRAESWLQGGLKAALHSSAGVIHVDITPGDIRLDHGTTYSTIVAHPADLGGNIKKVELTWEYELNVLEPKTFCLFWCNDHLYVESVTVDQLELPGREKRDASFSSKLCPKGKKEYSDIANRGKGVFVEPCPKDSDKFDKAK